MVKVMDHGHGTMERIVIIKVFFFFFYSKDQKILNIGDNIWFKNKDDQYYWIYTFIFHVYIQ